jgi:hypothetical protein
MGAGGGAGGTTGRGAGGGGKGVEVQPAKIIATLVTRRSGICLRRNGANMFIRCLEKYDVLRDLLLLAIGKPVMCLKKRCLSPGFDLKGNQL